MKNSTHTSPARVSRVTLTEALETLDAYVRGSEAANDYLASHVHRIVRAALNRARRRKQRGAISPRKDQLPLPRLDDPSLTSSTQLP